MKRKGTKGKKKPYRSPRLVRYGDLAQLTKMDTVKGGNMQEGMGAPPTRA